MDTTSRDYHRPMQSDAMGAERSSSTVELPSSGTLNGPARWLFPSLATVLFVAVFVGLCFAAPGLFLRDGGDTAWHVLHGQRILALGNVARTDPFSYTAAGQPWYAYEWLWDLCAALLHRALGMGGVVLGTGFIVSLALAALFQTMLRRTSNLVVSLGFFSLTLVAAMVHVLARPHVTSWLFVLLFLVVLEAATDKDDIKKLLWLPPLTVVWANTHGGFLIGIVLCLIFCMAQVWSSLIVNGRREGRRTAAGLAVTAVACFLGGLLNPYGLSLYTHFASFLTTPFLMDIIGEFQSPNFHLVAEKAFEGLLLITVALLALSGPVRLRTALLIVFAVHISLLSARNLPIGAIVLSVVGAPIAARAFDGWRHHRSGFVRRRLEALTAMSSRIARIDAQVRGGVVGALVVVGVSAVLVARPDSGVGRLDPGKFPVAALGYLRANNISDHLFAPDTWGGFLLYELRPSFRVMVDDRFDFYGETLLRRYHATISVGSEWRTFLDEHSARWALLPVRAPLTTVLREADDWELVYQDATAVIFRRAAGLY